MNIGEAFQLRTKVESDDYTGSYINSTYPITVFSGHECGLVPDNDYTRCGHMEAEVPPLEVWGREYIVPKIPGRGGDNVGYVLRVIASEDDTLVYMSYPGPYEDVDIVQAGNYYEHDQTVNSEFSAYINCSNPCMVVQYNKANRFDYVGTNPFMLIITPIRQHSANYRFGVPLMDYQKNSFNWVSIVAPTANTKGFVLDGASLDGEIWDEVDGTPYSVAGVAIDLDDSGKLNTLYHNDPIVRYAAYQYGNAEDPQSEGYAFSLGTELNECEYISLLN